MSSLAHKPTKVTAYLALTGGTDIALAYLPTLVAVEKIKADSDAVAALASGVFRGSGLVILSGTGCVAYARRAGAEGIVGGGWGYLLGDEGSGFWIGMQAIKASIRVEDGKGTPTAMTRQVMAQLGVQDMRQAAARIYDGSLTRPEIARLAPVILVASDQGDADAFAIVQQAARELFALALATARRANFTHPEDKVIVAAGGIMYPESAVLREFARLVSQGLPDYTLVTPRLPPVVGAYVLGLEMAGVKVNNAIIRTIESSYINLLSTDAHKAVDDKKISLQ